MSAKSPSNISPNPNKAYALTFQNPWPPFENPWPRGWGRCYKVTLQIRVLEHFRSFWCADPGATANGESGCFCWYYWELSKLVCCISVCSITSAILLIIRWQSQWWHTFNFYIIYILKKWTITFFRIWSGFFYFQNYFAMVVLYLTCLAN